MSRASFQSWVVSCALAWPAAALWAQQPAAALAGLAPGAAAAAMEPRSMTEWLTHMHQASRTRSYVGTIVVSSDASMASARIWHACEGTQQIERIESLTGPARSTFRRDDHVVTFLPDSKTALIEKRSSPGAFPSLLQGAAHSSIPDYYTARDIGDDRVAGFDTDVVQLKAKDKQRYGYRIWSEKRTGLVMKMQTLDAHGRVLEQAAFSELQLNAPVRMAKLSQMMANTAGYRTEVLESEPTDPAAEGWELKSPVAGFRSMRCIKRATQAGLARPGTVQWVFSDGLASVSLFLEPYDPRTHLKEGLLAVGATQSLTQRLDDWWLTAVGEVPPVTLKAFAQSLERTK